MPLTEKQRLFARELKAGATKSDAYRKAYSTDKMKVATVNRKACVLSKDPDVVAYMAELEEKIEAEFIVTAAQKKMWLADIAETHMRKVMVTAEGSDEPQCMGMVDGKTAISAISELNKMDGDLASQKIDLNANIEQADRVRKLQERLARGK